MRIYNQREVIRRQAVDGSGLVNTLINKLPIEVHLPGYRFCGPGTRLKERLERGDRGVNLLDEACREHDIAYSQSRDLSKRHVADRILASKAFQRFQSKDAGFGEKAAALAITGIMKGKTTLGMGARRGVRRTKKGGVIGFQQAVARARHHIKGAKDTSKAAKLALAAIGRVKVRAPRGRVLRIPKTGGILPLIPIFSALGALGSLGGGAAAVIKAIAEAKNAKNKLQEKERHNRAIEAISIGRGLHLGPYKGGYGLYLSKNFR